MLVHAIGSLLRKRTVRLSTLVALPLIAGSTWLARHWLPDRPAPLAPEARADSRSAEARGPAAELAQLVEAGQLTASVQPAAPIAVPLLRDGEPVPQRAHGPELVMSFTDGSTRRVPADRYLLIGERLTIYAEDGSIEEAGPWDGQHKQGVWEYFDSDGTRVLMGRYVDGLAEGNWLAWHSDGRLRGQADIVAGAFHGFKAAWDENGLYDLESSGDYDQGAKVR